MSGLIQSNIRSSSDKGKIEKRLRHFQKHGAVPYDRPIYWLAAALQNHLT